MSSGVECGYPGQPLELVWRGPVLEVQIGLDLTSYRQKNYPNLSSDKYHALIDTGATESCIDSRIAVILALPVVDRQVMSGAHGAHDVNIHLAQIYSPALDTTIYGKFAGVHLHAGGRPYSALIGRTFFQNWIIEYNGKTGSVIFRTP